MTALLLQESIPNSVRHKHLASPAPLVQVILLEKLHTDFKLSSETLHYLFTFHHRLVLNAVWQAPGFGRLLSLCFYRKGKAEAKVMSPQVLLSEHGRLMSVPDTGSTSGFFFTCNPHLLITSVFKHKKLSGLPRCNPRHVPDLSYLPEQTRMWLSHPSSATNFDWDSTCCDRTVLRLDHAAVPDSSDLRGIKNQIRHQALNWQCNTPSKAWPLSQLTALPTPPGKPVTALHSVICFVTPHFLRRTL